LLLDLRIKCLILIIEGIKQDVVDYEKEFLVAVEFVILDDALKLIFVSFEEIHF
jgi:hypothetical protein